MKKSTFADRLLTWFDQHGRKHLPWQIDPTPYRVWVSEIMLQQTQVATVIPYYLRFMDAFPTVAALANAPLDHILGFWSGLGYYARARHLHKAAQLIREKYQGEFPLDFDSVLSLPGIGRSTAGAILAFSTGQRHAILDGNVKRILCRHEAFPFVPNTPQRHEQLWAIAEHYTPQTRVSAYTQAVMDLGATLCTRSKPRCPDCPVQNTCQARRLDRVNDFPVKAPKPPKPIQTRLFLIIHSPKGILLYQRPTSGIWGGLWSLPEWPDVPASQRKITAYCQGLISNRQSIKPSALLCLPPVSHQFTHYQLLLKPMVFITSSSQRTPLFDEQPTQWYKANTLHTIGLPAPIKRLLQQQLVEGVTACRERCTA